MLSTEHGLTNDRSAEMLSANDALEINCFGCAATNPIGLKLEFENSGHQSTCRFSLGPDYESYPGVIHGGIVATILDEALSQTVYHHGNGPAFTVGLRVRYGHPMQTNMPYVAISEIVRSNRTLIRASGRIQRDTGELVAAAVGSFYLISEDGLEEMRSVSLERCMSHLHEPDGVNIRGT
jgi:acyl-coenzyme A thioesterase PaaI-like protein